MLKDFQPRLYQETIFNVAINKNTLVVLPTGLGKTGLALMLAAHRLQNYPNSKILFLAPTRPLVQQHYQTFIKHLDLPASVFAVFSGLVAPEERKELWKNSKIIFSTPQTIENDILNKRVDLESASLVIFDEAHRAVGDYAYGFIAGQYEKKAKYPKILGLTASPGSDETTIKDVCTNLFIDAIEARDERDSDVKPYVQDVEIEWIAVELSPEFRAIKKYLDDAFSSKLHDLASRGLATGDLRGYSKSDLLKLQANFQGRIASGEKDFEMLKSISSLAEALKIQHAIELLETQGLEQLRKYLKGIQEQAVTSKIKAVKNLVQDPNFIAALEKTESLLEKNSEHPKLAKLTEILKAGIEKNPAQKIIIFTQYRDTVVKLKTLLDSIGISNKTFVGQAKKKDTGLSQKEQKEIIREFSEGNFNALISTSIGEEGLDIPQVDLVIFYEPIPSAIRTVQRRGRTGRTRKGQVIVLFARNTRDEAYKWSAHHKEKRMQRSIKTLKNALSFENFPKKESNLLTFFDPEKVTICIDYREKSSGIAKELVSMGVNIELKTLSVGDYLLSDAVAAEYKTIPDFVDSIIDGRLLSQIRNLITYPKPLLIVEGTEDLYSQRNIHPNAIRGMLSTISVSYRIPIMFTKTPKETANLMFIIARREQDPEKKEFQMHQLKPQTTKEQQEFIVAALPGIGAVLAPGLLSHFKTIRKIFSSKKEELEKISLIGDKKAAKIQELFDAEYKKEG